MYQKLCNLLKAATCFSGGPDTAQRYFGQEWPSIQSGIEKNIGEFTKFFPQGQSLLTGAGDAATSLMQYGTDKILPGAMKMFDTGMNTVLPAGTNLLNFGQDVVNAGKGDILNTINTHGALPGWQERDVGDATQAAASQMGMGHSLGTLGQRLMNRGAAQEARLNQAYGRAGTATNIGMSTLGGPAAALPFLTAPGSATGSFIQPALATEQTAASTYKGLSDPSWQYNSSLFDFNANAQQSTNNASANKTDAYAMAGIKSVGSIIGAVAMSDAELKEDIKDTGLKIHGIPIRTFRFKGSKDRQVGTVAQEVAKVRPDAVKRLSSGRLMVDYTKLLGKAA
jgi:hypothetical protein